MNLGQVLAKPSYTRDVCPPHLPRPLQVIQRLRFLHTNPLALFKLLYDGAGLESTCFGFRQWRQYTYVHSASCEEDCG